jgi:hypothetical protein
MSACGRAPVAKNELFKARFLTRLETQDLARAIETFNLASEPDVNRMLAVKVRGTYPNAFFGVLSGQEALR